MAPFIYTFVKDLSNTDQAKLFLSGAHVSIYVAHYEVIRQAGMGFFEALVAIIIIIVIIVVTVKTGGATKDGFFAFLKTVAGTAATAGVVAAVKLVLAKLATYAFKFIVSAIIQQIIVEIAGDGPLGQILSLMASVAIMSWDGNLSFDPDGTGSLFDSMGDMVGDIGTDSSFFSKFNFNSMTSFKNPLSFTPLQWASIGIQAFSGISTLKSAAIQTAAEALSAETTAWNRLRSQKLREIAELTEVDYGIDQFTIAAATQQSWRMRNGVPSSPQETIDGMLGIVPITLSSIAIAPEFDFYSALFDTA